MKLFLDCLPCMLRQVLDSSRMVTDNPEVHEKNHAGCHKIITGL
jgi:uncharacterized protein with ATP-grasp and redox domains